MDSKCMARAQGIKGEQITMTCFFHFVVEEECRSVVHTGCTDFKGDFLVDALYKAAPVVRVRLVFQVLVAFVFACFALCSCKHGAMIHEL
jgi:hypothetical protein